VGVIAVQRSTRLLAVPVSVALAALATGLAPSAHAASGDTTGAYGPFGFTTVGLGNDGSYGEPSLAYAPDGRHVVISVPGSDSAGNGTVQYWYSGDNGTTWAHSESTSPNGGGDSDVMFLPNGTLLSSDLEVKDSYIQKSTDFGKTWIPVGPSGIEQDRMWFAHSPDGQIVYNVYHDFAAEAEFYARSIDGGNTWPKRWAAQPVDSTDQITAPGAATTPKQGMPASLVDQGVNTFSGPMLVDNDGYDLYVVYSISDAQSNLDPQDGVPPFGPTRGIVVAHSADGGLHWTSHYAWVAPPNPTSPSSEPIEGAIFPWGSVDAAGNVYVVYNSTDGTDATNEHYHQYYVYSTDKGATWSKPIQLDTLPKNTGAAVYATSAAGAPGVLDVAWYQSDNGVPSDTATTTTWTPHFAQVTDAASAHPAVVQQAVTTIPNHRGGICLEGILCGVGPGSGDRSLLDFFQVQINPVTGMAGIAYADNGGRAGKNVGEVVFAQQTAGPSALAVPGGSVPEAPLAALLGVAGALVVGCAVLLRRRRTVARPAG
jgi:hypothetical protein